MKMMVLMIHPLTQIISWNQCFWSYYPVDIGDADNDGDLDILLETFQ